MVEFEQSKIETTRLILSEFCEDDKNDIFIVASNPNISRYTSWDTHKNIDDTSSYIEWIKGKVSSNQGGVFNCWAIRLKSEMSFIGAIDFTQKNESIGQIDYMLSEKHWNKGIMTEAAKSIVTWAFESIPSLTEVQCCGLSENVGSIRVMENIGFSLRKQEICNIEKFGNVEKEVSCYFVARKSWLEND